MKQHTETRPGEWLYEGECYRVVWNQRERTADLVSEDHLQLRAIQPAVVLEKTGTASPTGSVVCSAPHSPRGVRASLRSLRKLFKPRLLILSITEEHSLASTDNSLEIVSPINSRMPGLSLSYTLVCHPREVELRLSITNTSSQPLRIQRLIPCMCQLVLEAPDAAWSCFKMSSNTSTPSGSVSLAGSERGFGFRWIPLFLLPDVIRRMLYLPGESYSWRKGHVSSQWFTLLSHRSKGPSLLLGFQGSHRHFSSISIDRHSGLLSAAAITKGLEIPPGGSFHLHSLVAIFGDTPHQCLKRYLDIYTNDMPPRTRRISLWGSWYAGFYDRFTSRDLYENLDLMTPKDRPALVEYFQIDDGYQKALGDWLETKMNLPDGLKAFAQEVHKRGLRPGIWLAPFAISRDSSVFQNHPDWLVSNANGRPRIAGLMPGRMTLRPYYALDLTRPQVQQWLATLFQTLVEWGFRLFKLDYLAAGALQGHRFDQQCTSAQAYTLGLSIIRKAVGDLPLMGALAPLLAGVGWMDMQRISTDTSFAGNSWQKRAQRLLGDPITPCVRNNIRNNLTRAFFDGRIWTNDCDALVYKGLSPDERQTHFSVNLLAGGVNQIGHDMRNGSSLLQEVERLRHVVTRSLTVPDLFEKEYPQELIGIAEHTDRPDCHVFYLLINTDDRSCTKTIRDPAHYLSQIRVDWSCVLDFWEDRTTPLKVSDTIELRPHGCKLFFFRIKED